MAGKSPMQKIQDAGEIALAFQPEKGKGTSITLAALEERYGKKNAKEVYFRVALAGGYGNFRNMSFANLPPLDTTGLKGEALKVVEETLTAADVEFKTAEPESAKE